MFIPKNIDLGEAFAQYFRILPAWSEELKEEAYRIRHQVYCRDCGFEAPRPDERETDEYDQHSMHLLTQSLITGEYVGCLRVILNRDDDELLPLEKFCGPALDLSLAHLERVPRSQLAEASRLAVTPNFRRRKGEARTPVALDDPDFGNPEQPRFPFIPLGLYCGAVEMARLAQVDNLLFLSEPRLASHIGRLGFPLTSIGTPVEHRGKRVPMLLHTPAVEQSLWHAIRPIYRLVADSIRSGAPSHLLREPCSV